MGTWDSCTIVLRCCGLGGAISFPEKIAVTTLLQAVCFPSAPRWAPGCGCGIHAPLDGQNFPFWTVEFLEAEGFKYAIRLPANKVLQESIGYLLKRPVGRPPIEVRPSGRGRPRLSLRAMIPPNFNAQRRTVS